LLRNFAAACWKTNAAKPPLFYARKLLCNFTAKCGRATPPARKKAVKPLSYIDGSDEMFSFLKQYVLKPRTVGAVAPSSKYLAAKMMAGIDFASAQCIVEFGPGTGVFTDEILRRRQTGALVLLLERDAAFCEMLRKKYIGHDHLHIINDSAEHIGKYLHVYGGTYGIKTADYIVSGLPFASLPQDVSESILTAAVEYLKPSGKFITFQYTLLRKAFIGKYFSSIEITREVRNLPPAYVFLCSHVG